MIAVARFVSTAARNRYVAIAIRKPTSSRCVQYAIKVISRVDKPHANDPDHLAQHQDHANGCDRPEQTMEAVGDGEVHSVHLQVIEAEAVRPWLGKSLLWPRRKPQQAGGTKECKRQYREEDPWPRVDWAWLSH